MHKRGLHEQTLKFLPDGDGWLLVEFGGDKEEDARNNAEK